MHMFLYDICDSSLHPERLITSDTIIHPYHVFKLSLLEFII